MNETKVKSYIGKTRVFTNPKTKRKESVSVIKDEIVYPKNLKGHWGDYHFRAWLEEDEEGYFTISFVYWRNGKFAAQTSFRAEPGVVRFIFQEMLKRGWLEKKGWSDE